MPCIFVLSHRFQEHMHEFHPGGNMHGDHGIAGLQDEQHMGMG